MRTARKNDHLEKLMRDSVFIYGWLYVSPSLPQDDSDQAENTEQKTDYASLTKAGIYTTPKASQRQRFSKSNFEYQDRKRSRCRRTPNKTKQSIGDQTDREFKILTLNVCKINKRLQYPEFKELIAQYDNTTSPNQDRRL